MTPFVLLIAAAAAGLLIPAASGGLVIAFVLALAGGIIHEGRRRGAKR